MSGNSKKNNSLEEADILMLTDEDGNETEFEFVDSVEYNGNEYYVLFPCAVDADKFVIFRVEDGDAEDEASYMGIQDDSELQTVFEIFRQKHIEELEN